VNHELDRRTFLRRGAFGAAGVALLGNPLLAACSSDKKTSTSSGGSSSSGKSFGALNFQLSWIKNVEFAGMYIARDKGYYTANGFSSVNLIGGGPNVPQDAVVAAGDKAFIGTSDPLITAAAIVSKESPAKLIVIGAQYQKSPFCITSLATSPIKVPGDMKGKKIGVQDVNTNIWEAFLKVNNIADSDLTTVPVQFSTAPLVEGQVDGYFSFVTNEPLEVTYQTKKETATMLLSDYGLPLASQHYIVNTDVLKSDRDKIKAALKSEVMGWRDALKDAALGAHLTVTNSDKADNLEEAEQLLESKAQNELILTSDTKANGIFTISDDLVAKTIETLGKTGTSITADKLYDLSLIKEIYSENPDLKASPV